MSDTGLKNAFTYLGNNVGLEIEQFQNLRIGSGPGNSRFQEYKCITLIYIFTF